MEYKKIFSLSDIQYYAMDGKHFTFVGMRLTLDSDVNPEILQECANKCRRRMPYYFFKKAFIDNEMQLVENEAEFKVNNDPLDYIIDESNNDNFLVRLSYNKNIVTFYMYHGLSDAGGMAAYMKVLLTEYYKKLGEEVIPASDILDIDGEINPKEYDQPMEYVPEDIVPAKREKYSCYKIKSKKTKSYFTYTFSVEKEELLEYAKSFDGSPNALTAIAVAKAVKSFATKKDKDPICVGVAINTKPIIGCKDSMLLSLLSGVFHFDDKAFEMDPELLDTCVRGRIIFESSKDEVISHLAAARVVKKLIDALPTYRARQLFCTQALSTVSSTFTVSYIGAVKWGSIEKHIKSILTYCDGGAPIVEINYINDRFFFSTTSNMDLKDYVYKLHDIFKDMGFVCSDIEKQVFNTNPRKTHAPKFGLNKETLMIIKAAKALANGAK